MGTRRTQLRHFSEKKNEEEKKSKDLVPGQFPQLIDVKPFFFPPFSALVLSLSLSLHCDMPALDQRPVMQ